MQANQAKQWALQMEQQVSAAETRAQELVGLVAALNCQLEEASSSGHHTDHSSEQEHDSSASLYSHFEGKGIFGGGGSSLWFQDPVASCPAGQPCLELGYTPGGEGGRGGGAPLSLVFCRNWYAPVALECQ